MANQLAQTRELVHKYLWAGFGILVLPKLITLEEIPGTLTWHIDARPDLNFARELNMCVWLDEHHEVFRAVLGTFIMPILAHDILKLPGFWKAGRGYPSISELEATIRSTKIHTESLRERTGRLKTWNDDSMQQIIRLKMLGAEELIKARMNLNAQKKGEFVHRFEKPNGLPDEMKPVTGPEEKEDTEMSD